MSAIRIFSCAILFATGLLAGCRESAPVEAPEVSCQESFGQLVYSPRFAQIYGLPKAEAIELSEGLLAVRAYWTEYVHAQGRPYLQVQIYVDRELGSSLEESEGSLAHFEAYVRSGFEYFPAEPTLRVDPETQYREFYNRLILHAPELGTKTEAINRYKLDLAPGVTAIEFNTAFRAPFDIYFYTGTSAGTDKIDPLFYALTRGENINKYLDDFAFFSIPDQLKGLMASGCES